MFFLLAVLVVAILVLITINLTKKHGAMFDKEAYQVNFLRIENSLQPGNEASYAMVIIQGDKLLDKALCEMGVQGRTMGDRMKKIGKEKNINEIVKIIKTYYIVHIYNLQITKVLEKQL